MRTTVTLDPDVEALVKTLMRERHIGFKRAINEAIRAGVGPPPNRGGQVSATPTFKMGFAPDTNLDKALALAARLEDDALARKLAAQK